MLHLTRHPSAGSFLQLAESWLMRAEAENNLILGFACAWAQDSSFFTTAPYLATVEDNGRTTACAFRSPPHKLVLTRLGERKAAKLLATDALSVYPDLGTALGPEPDIEAFAEAWADIAGPHPVRGMRQRIHEVRAVQRTGKLPPGTMRPATAADLDILVPWVSACFHEIGDVVQHEPAKLAQARMKSGSLFVWDDRGPVSMAGWSGKTTNGVRVNLVYTPPEKRSRGYAQACVSALTERLLAEGNGFCCLYTNLANPISNRIYERIGYRPVCDVSDFTMHRGQ
jgi:GNAT superfamily N-acetyltransferase